ncbi:hypothetical protein BHM03_00054618 [Ensete ventricosum]|nr:hypothetical protein BHM03_00054618 [Ensete ventricosum]
MPYISCFLAVSFLKPFLPLNKPRNYVPTDGDIMSKQFDEQKDQVAVEQILSVVFLDAEHPSPVKRRERYLAQQQVEFADSV